MVQGRTLENNRTPTGRIAFGESICKCCQHAWSECCTDVAHQLRGRPQIKAGFSFPQDPAEGDRCLHELPPLTGHTADAEIYIAKGKPSVGERSAQSFGQSQPRVW